MPSPLPINKLQYQQLRQNLPNFFGRLDDEVFEQILPLLEWQELKSGERLFAQGDAGRSMYILVSGRLQVVVDEHIGQAKVVGEIGKGETVGEMAAFTQECRSASVYAIRDSVLLHCPPTAYKEISKRYPLIIIHVTKMIIQRLRTHIHEIPKVTRVSNIAIVPISEGVDITHFSIQLIQELSSHGTCMGLSSRQIDDYRGPDQLLHAKEHSSKYQRLTNWLNEREIEHDYMIYQADRELTEWTRRCIRQADEILLVASTEDPPAISQLEHELLSGANRLSRANQSLILLHPNAHQSPTETTKWISPRQLKNHHHIRKASITDFQRLARFLCGEVIGLALAGGGARGLAHIGVYRALVEAGIPIDLVGGTSMGAMVGAFVAMQMPPDEVRERFLTMKRMKPTADYNLLPVVSLIKGRRLNRVIRKFYGGPDIEDLWLNFLCISSNLSTAQPILNRKGMLHKAIRASISLPGIFPPVVKDNCLLIDGGLFNNLPIDEVRKAGANKIISVDLNVEQDPNLSYEEVPSNWQIIKDWAYPGKKVKQDIPDMISTIIKASTLSSDYKSRHLKETVDLRFNPHIKKGILELRAGIEIIEAGYQHALEVLEKQNIDALKNY